MSSTHAGTDAAARTARESIRAALARLAAWPPARTTLIATCALVGFTYAVVGAAAPRLSDTERPVAAALLTGPHALDNVVVVVVIFGGPLAAALAGALAAIKVGSGRAPWGAPRPASPTSLLRTFVALAGLLLAGFGLASAGGSVRCSSGRGLRVGRRRATSIRPSLPTFPARCCAVGGRS